MDIGIAALIAWLLTAALGGVLLLMWVAHSPSRPLRRGRRPVYNRPPPYIPRPMIVAHVLLAVLGLAAWTAALTLAVEQFAYAALVAVLVVALLGAGMFVRWLGSRRARRVSRAHSAAPAESRLPTLVVLGHGMLGAATLLLVVLSAFRG
jgi:manganese efflux pump family protein